MAPRAGATKDGAEVPWRRDPPVTAQQAEWQRRASARAALCAGTWRAIVPQKLSGSSEKFKSYNRTCEASGSRSAPVHEEGDERPLLGLTFCFTGVLQWWPLKGDDRTPSWTSLVEARGGVVTASVTTRTRVLVAGSGVRRPGQAARGTGGGVRAAQSVSGTAKYRKAQERGLKIITEAELFTLCTSRVRKSWRFKGAE